MAGLLRIINEGLLRVTTIRVVLKLAPLVAVESPLHFIFVKVLSITIGAFAVAFLVRWSAKVPLWPLVLVEGFLLEGWCLVVFL